MSTLVGWWKFEDDCVDSVNGNNAIGGNGAGSYGYDTGCIDRCAYLADYNPTQESTWGFYTMPYISQYAFNSSGAFSIEAWFKIDNELGDEFLLFGTGEYPTLGQRLTGFGVDLQLVTGSGTQEYTGNEEEYSCIARDTWFKAKVTYNNQRWELYINDVLQNPSNYYDSTYVINEVGFRFCGYKCSGDYETKKIRIDELKIYNDGDSGPVTYYVDINNSYTDIGDGTEIAPFNYDQFRTYANAEGDTFKLRGQCEIGIFEKVVTPIGYNVIAWDLQLYGPWRVHATGYFYLVTRALISDGIVVAQAANAIEAVGVKNLFLQSLIADVQLPTRNVVVDGCTLIAHGNVEISTMSYPGVTNDTIIVTGETTGERLIGTFNKCVFSINDIPSTKNNCQFNWIPPTWPAWDAPLSEFTKSKLNYSGINRGVGFPGYGTPPYTGYEYNLSGNARNDIGAYAGSTRTVRFTDASKGLVSSTDFDFGDGSAHATSLPVDHEYNLDAIGEPYTVDATLTVTGSKGQTDSITKTINLAGA